MSDFNAGASDPTSLPASPNPASSGADATSLPMTTSTTVTATPDGAGSGGNIMQGQFGPPPAVTPDAQREQAAHLAAEARQAVKDKGLAHELVTFKQHYGFPLTDALLIDGVRLPRNEAFPVKPEMAEKLRSDPAFHDFEFAFGDTGS